MIDAGKSAGLVGTNDRSALERLGFTPPRHVPPAPEPTGCEWCDRPHDWTAETVPAFLAATMCDEHSKAVSVAQAERLLRPILPKKQSIAKPSDIVAGLKDWTPQAGWVYLYGPVGEGKTYQGVALLKRSWAILSRLHGNPPSVAYLNVGIAEIDALASFAHGAEPFDWKTPTECDVLMLDDIGLNRIEKEWFRKRLYALVEYRLQNDLCTIVTSNVDVVELGKRLDSPQIASRIAGQSIQVHLSKSGDRRAKSSPKL